MIDPTSWRNLEGLMLRAQTMVDGLYSGAHPSPQRGPGLEFHDYRPYAPGEDLSGIDWKLYGRTDRYYLRRYRRYTDLQAYVLVDVSASMTLRSPRPANQRRSSSTPGRAAVDGLSQWSSPRAVARWLRRIVGFGQTRSPSSSVSLRARPGHHTTVPGKLELSRDLAAAIAMISLRQSDRVGLGLADSRLVDHVPPGSTWAHLQRLSAKLEAYLSQPQPTANEMPPRVEQPANLAARRFDVETPAKGRASQPGDGASDETETRDQSSGFAAGIDHAVRVLSARGDGRGGGLVIVISDMLDEPCGRGGLLDALGRLRHSGWEVIVLQVLSPEELDLNELGPPRMHLRDRETSTEVRTHIPSVARRYHRLIREHIETLDRGCRAAGIDHALIRTDHDPIESLRTYLTWRQSRGRASR